MDTARTFHALVGGLEHPIFIVTALVGGLERPMFIVTARAGDDPLGCRVGFTTQTSIDAPRLLVCLSRKHRNYRHGRDADLLGVHCPPAHATEPAEPSGGETADEVDEFARTDRHDGPGSLPRLDECPNRFAGRVPWWRRAGDHDAFLLEPIAAEKGTADDGFPFQRAKRIEARHEV